MFLGHIMPHPDLTYFEPGVSTYSAFVEAKCRQGRICVLVLPLNQRQRLLDNLRNFVDNRVSRVFFCLLEQVEWVVVFFGVSYPWDGVKQVKTRWIFC